MASEVAKPLKTLNLNLAKDRLMLLNKHSEYVDATPLVNVINGPFESPLIVDGGKIVKGDEDSNDYYIVNGNAVFHQYSYNGLHSLAEFAARPVKKRYPFDIIGAFFPHKGKTIFATSGDDNNSHEVGEFISYLALKDQPTVSYECLQRFYDNDRTKLLKKIADKEIQIMDFTADSKVKLNAEQRKIIRRKDGVATLAKKPPEPGYTLINQGGWIWHRSATVLFYDAKSEMTILIGQDEGTYFGVELPVPSKTIKAAFNDLIPKEVQGKPFKRQGEWFAINVKESEVPSIEDSKAEFNQITLPRESDDSNRHELYCSDGRIGKDGAIFANEVRIEHNDHAELVMDGWCRFYVNTAIRSFSVEGVD